MPMDASARSSTILPAHAVVGGVEETPIGNISGLSVVSLLLGLAAPLSLAAPLLWAIPLFGAALAMVTMRRVASSDGVLIGRRAAVIGLALSVASLCAAATRSVVSEQMLSHQARSIALEWLALVESGDVSSAYGYTTDSTRSPGPPHEPGRPEPPRDPVTDFRGIPLIHFLMSVGKGARTDFDKDLDIADDSNGVIRVRQQFLVIPAGGSDSSAVVLHVTLERSRRATINGAKWLVAEYGSDNLPALPDGE
jgi:hypothetical protein